MPAAALFKTVLIPPIAALALYLLLTYLLLPYYRRYRERRTYSLVPSNILPGSLSDNITPNTATNTVARVVQAISSAMLRASGSAGLIRWRRGSAGSMQGFGIGDEELEEGITAGGENIRESGRGRRVRGDGEGQGRLSRELEGGFMSDSDSEGEG